MTEREKDELMRTAMAEFNSKLEESGGVMNGVKYKQDLDIEIQIRIDYLKDLFDKDEVDLEISKYKNSEGIFIEDIVDERIWNSIVSNLESKNI